MATAASCPLCTTSFRQAAQDGVQTFCHTIPVEKFQEGDVLFPTYSRRSRAVQLATRSLWFHCGMLYEKNGQFHVFEAVQPVKSTPLETVYELL